MQAQSRTLLFSLSSAVAVGAIAFISWRIADQSPRVFNRVDMARSTTAEPVASPPAQLALKGDSTLDASGGAAISSGALFDIVRVEPTGEAVVAGRAQPGAIVRLLNNGVV